MPALVIASPTAGAAQLASRSVTLSDSSPSGAAGAPATGVGSGTNVTYQFSFTTSASAESLVIDFCGDTPLVGDSCAAPTGFDASGATVSTVTSGGNIGGWTLSASTSHLELDGTSATAATAGAQVFNINGITNPSTVSQGFYARVTTYAGTTAAAAGYTGPATPGTYVDYGGLAISTSNVIEITARVMESLQFCVSGVAPTANCGGTTLPDIILGHGPKDVLNASAVDTNQVYSQLSTNALHGAVIKAHLNNACGGLSRDGGTTCDIPAVNSGASTPAAITAGTAAFGMMVQNGTGGTGTITADPNYNDGTDTTCDDTAFFGMDTTSTGGNNVVGTFGDLAASSTTAVNNVNNLFCFGATASNITPAGLYSADISLIATGTF